MLVQTDQTTFVTFDSEAVKTMSLAYDRVLDYLGDDIAVNDAATEAFREFVASQVIKSAMTGVSDPNKLYTATLVALRARAH